MPRLRRSNIKGNGIARRRCGRGFTYRWSNGQRVVDREVLDRIDALAIPPAWQEVWICPWPHGHIQAVGTDAAGRRQYRYHDAWRKQRDREKFERTVEFGQALPHLREVVNRDLDRRGLDLRRVAAVGVRLLDIGCFRVGNAEYAEEHETFGIATLRHDHVAVAHGEVTFSYQAKGSIDRTVTVRDAQIHRAVRSLRRRRSGHDELLAWKKKDEWVNVGASDLNDYIKSVAGEQFSAKDFRTWSGTVLAAVALATTAVSTNSERSRQRAVAAAIKEVAEYLGNTPAVCRSSYVDPRIIDRFEAGDTVAVAVPKLAEEPDRHRLACRAEAAVLALLTDHAAAA
jgi:DNA topoisomerase-1